MRTTLALDDEALSLARNYAEARGLPLGRAVSELVKKGAEYRCNTKVVNGLTVFELPEDAPVLTTEEVERLLDEM